MIPNFLSCPPWVSCLLSCPAFSFILTCPLHHAADPLPPSPTLVHFYPALAPTPAWNLASSLSCLLFLPSPAYCLSCCSASALTLMLCPLFYPVSDTVHTCPISDPCRASSPCPASGPCAASDPYPASDFHPASDYCPDSDTCPTHSCPASDSCLALIPALLVILALPLIFVLNPIPPLPMIPALRLILVQPLIFALSLHSPCPE